MLDRAYEVTCVWGAGQIDAGRDNERVPCIAEHCDEPPIYGVVVQIEIHPVGRLGTYGGLSSPSSLIRASSRARSASNKALLCTE